jgi:hypothetical protein
MARRLTRRESVLLGGLVAAGAAYLYWGSVREASRLTPVAAGAEPGSLKFDPPVVQMALLTRPPEEYDPEGRDLFKYAQRPETAAERRTRAAAEAERVRELHRQAEAQRRRDEERRKQEALLAEVTARTPQPPPRPPAPTPPRVNFTYLGYLGPKEDRIAVFEHGDELLLARAGEVIQEHFRIKEIRYQRVVLGYTRDEFKNQTTELTMKVK